MVIIDTCGPRYSTARTRQPRARGRHLQDSMCRDTPFYAVAKQPETPKIEQLVPASVNKLNMQEKDPPQKISDLLADMIACNTEERDEFMQLAFKQESGEVEEPWSRDVLSKPNFPPSDMGAIMSRHSSSKSLSRDPSKEICKAMSRQISSSSSMSASSAKMCAMAAAAEAELRAAKARQENGFEQGPDVLLQLGSQAANAASRLRSRLPPLLVPPAHPPLLLPPPMRMHLIPAAAPKAQQSTELNKLEVQFHHRSTLDLDQSRSRRVAEISLHIPNPLSASNFKRLAEQRLDEGDEEEDDDEDEEEEEDAGSADEKSGGAPPSRRQSALPSEAFELPFEDPALNGVMPHRIVPNLLKKTRREQDEVAEALNDLETIQNSVQNSATKRKWPAQGAIGNHRLAMTGGPQQIQHRLSVMLGLPTPEDVPPVMPKGSLLRVDANKCSSRRSSMEVPGMLRKAELSIDEDEGNNQSILESLTLRSDRDERLERLRKLTTLHRSARRSRWDGVSQEEREHFQEVFQRYDYNRSGGLDIVEIHDALADLGLKPGTRKEKMEMAKLAANQDCNEFDFKHFCRIVRQRRKRTQEANRSKLKHIFDQYDRDSSGSLDADELMEVFNSLTLTAHQEDERIAFLDAVLQCDINGSGEIEWEEFEPLVQRVTEKLGQCRRQREVRMREHMKLPPDIFLNFRSQLIHFHEAFRQFEQAEHNTLPGQAAIHVGHVGQLAVSLGMVKDQKSFHEAWGADEELRALLVHRDCVDFGMFLQVAQRLRVFREGQSGQSLRVIFDMYDVDNSGDLSIDELYRLMRDLGFEISSSLRGDVRRLFEESDFDGSGLIEYREFPQLFHGICDMLHKHQRNKEWHAARDLGFSESEFHDLREVFQMLDTDNAGSLKFEDVKTALSVMGEKTVSSDGLRKYDGFHIGRLDFTNFLKAMKDIKPTLASATACKRRAIAIPGSARSPSLHSGGSEDDQ